MADPIRIGGTRGAGAGALPARGRAERRRELARAAGGPARKATAPPTARHAARATPGSRWRWRTTRSTRRGSTSTAPSTPCARGAAAQSQATEPLVPAAASQRRVPCRLPDDVAALLRAAGKPPGTRRTEARPAPAPAAAVAAAVPGTSARSPLAERLERLEGPPEAEAKPRGPTRATGEDRARPRPRPAAERQAHPVCRRSARGDGHVRGAGDAGAACCRRRSSSADLGTERNSALFERLRSLDEAPEPAGQTHSPADAADEEAEVTIVSVEQLKAAREADERAGIVRRFRKALSGD